jgi:hypothetical protein
MTGEPRRGALRFANLTLSAGVALAAVSFLVALPVHRRPALAYAPLALALALLAARVLLGPVWRVRLAIALLPAMLGAWGAELVLGRSRIPDGTAAERRGQRFDTRTVWDAVSDLRREGVAAYPQIDPITLVAGVPAAGATVQPVGGMSGTTVVWCNEGGAYATYESDERGFDNPRGLWGRGRLDVGIVGEGFAEGACVPRGARPADLIRARFPATLSLALSGDGPLLELAGIDEYLAPLAPRVVLWLHYHDALAALEAEKASPILRRYLEGGFTQGLAGKQAAIDEALAEVARQRQARGAIWPAPFGIARAPLPMWAQDLITGDQHASASAFLRLDRLHGFVAARLPERHAARGRPDYALYRSVLERAKAAVGAWGGTLWFVYLADVHDLRGTDHPTRAAVMAMVKDLGLPLVDVHPVFAAVPDPMSLRYHEASHLDEAGYALLARTVLAAITRP